MALLDAAQVYGNLMQPGDDGEIDLLASLLRRPLWMADGACTDEPSERFFAKSQRPPSTR